MEKYKIIKEVEISGNQDITYYLVIGSKKIKLATLSLNNIGKYYLDYTLNNSTGYNYNINLIEFNYYDFNENEHLLKIDFELNVFNNDNTAIVEMITICEVV